jgi:uncharacterized protein with beta-barrel porin domain
VDGAFLGLRRTTISQIFCGLDYMLMPNWIVGVDFNYGNFKFDRSATNTDGTLATWLVSMGKSRRRL